MRTLNPMNPLNLRKLTGSLALALIALAAMAVLAMAVPASAAEGDGGQAPGQVNVTGWIVDEWCQSANANANGKGCSLDCHKKGAALVLYDPDSQKVYHLDAQDQAEKNVGRVIVTGKLDGDKLAVAKIEPAPEAR